MAIAAGVIAVMAKQSNSAATAAAADQYGAMFAEARLDPDNTEALEMAVAAHDFERGCGKPQVGEIGVFQTDVGLDDLAGIARDDVAQVIDID